MDDFDFRHRADLAMESLQRALRKAEEDADFEVEDQGGALHVTFDEPPAHWVISPNSAVHQIWISARSASFKLDWSNDSKDFVFAKTGEKLKPLLMRLMNEQFGEQAVQLR